MMSDPAQYCIQSEIAHRKTTLTIATALVGIVPSPRESATDEYNIITTLNSQMRSTLLMAVLGVLPMYLASESRLAEWAHLPRSIRAVKCQEAELERQQAKPDPLGFGMMQLHLHTVVEQATICYS